MISIAHLENRFLKDPLPLRLGAVASDLARLSGLQPSVHNSIFQNVLTEVKLFTEWAAPDSGLEVQERLLDLQRALARGTSEEISKIAGQWADQILGMSGLIPDKSARG